MPSLIEGLWNAYQIVQDFTYEGDEEVVFSIIDEMLSMCGNAGQESLIGDYADNFTDWALEVLEEAGWEPSWADFRKMVALDWYGDLDKWNATDLIWAHGYSGVSDQSGFHDSADETGEGTGEEF